MDERASQSRRGFLTGLAASGVAGASALGLPRLGYAQAPLAPTPACGDADGPTVEQTEGPYFKRNSPERASLREAGFAGTALVLTGTVASRSCRPLGRVLVELWHCDDAGNYDNVGMRGRAHQFTDPAGQYRFATVVPGLYPGRTRHFHFKFQAANRGVLTTQSYFPGEARNAADQLFDRRLLMQVSGTGAAERQARFDVVLDIA